MRRIIASIWFEELKVERPIYGGHYVLPAVEKGERPAMIAIDNAVQVEPLPQIIGGGQIPRLIGADDIAFDVVAHMAEKGFGMGGDSGPGVWVVRDTLPELDDEGQPVMETVFDAKGKGVQRIKRRPATEAEARQMFDEDLDAARARQDRYGDYLITAGDILAEDPKQRILITARMKAACAYYGRERAWLQELRDDDTKHCPLCTKPVPANAIKCQCGGIVDIAAYATYEAQVGNAVREAKKAA